MVAAGGPGVTVIFHREMARSWRGAESGHAADGRAFDGVRLRYAGVLVALAASPDASSQTAVAVKGVEGAEPSQRGTDGVRAGARFSNGRMVGVLGIIGMVVLVEPAKSQRRPCPVIAISEFQLALGRPGQDDVVAELFGELGQLGGGKAGNLTVAD